MTRRFGENGGGARAIIAVLVSAKAIDTEERIRALATALAARGVEVVGTVVQRRGVSRSRSRGGAKRLDSPMSGATFLGPGKAQELALLAQQRGASAVYFLNDLSAAQTERLSALTGCAVIACPNSEPPPRI